MLEENVSEIGEEMDLLEEDIDPYDGREYWAGTQNQDSLRSYIDDRVERYFEFCERRGFIEMWRRVFAQVHALNEDAMGEMGANRIMFRGDDAELMDLRINDFRSFERQMLAMITGHRPGFQVQSTNTDYASTSQNDIGQGVAEYFWTHERIEEKHRSVVLTTQRYSIGYSWVWWDPDGGPEIQTEQGTKPAGKLRVRRKYPWEVVVDPFVDEEDDHEWRTVLHRENRWNLVARYPEMAEAILDADTSSLSEDRWMVMRDHEDISEDDIAVTYFYHARTPALPEGRLFVYAGRAVIYDGPLPEDEIPVIELTFGRFEGTALGYAESWGWLPIQEMIDSVVGSAATNVDTFGQQLIAVSQNADLDIEAVAAGYRLLEIPEGATPPQAITLAEVPEAARWLLEYLHRRFEEVTGLNSVARGQPDANIKSGTMAALFHAIAVEFQSFSQAQADHHVERVMTMVLRILRRHAHHPQMAMIAGNDEQHKLIHFTGEDLEGYDRVLVTSANPMLRQPSGKMEIARLAMEIPGAVRTPEQLMQIVTNGQLKPTLKASKAQLDYIQYENEQLARGTPVEEVPAQLPPGTEIPPDVDPPMDLITPEVPVLITDDPKLHVTEHLAVLCSPEARRDPKIAQGALAHIQWHLREAKQADPYLAQLMGFHLPAPAMGPGGGPKETPEVMEPPGELDNPGMGVDMPSPAESPNH